MQTRLYVGIDIVLSVVNHTTVFVDDDQSVVSFLSTMANGNWFVCPTEMDAVWQLTVAKLRAEHEWLINAEPSPEVVRMGFVGLWAWLDKKQQRYGPMVLTSPLDPDEVPYCLIHRNR